MIYASTILLILLLLGLFQEALIIELSKPLQLTLSVYNINGQLVNVLLSEKFFKSNFQLMWNGMDQNGNHLSSGVYWYLLKASAESGLQKKIQNTNW